MKKILSTLMVATIIALFILTWYCSRKAEQHFTAQIASINQTSPELISIELTNYQRRLFSATAETVVKIMAQEPISLEHQIRHFAWGVKMITTLAPDSNLVKSLTSKVPLNKLQLITDINLKGVSQSRLELPQFKLKGNKGELEITGFDNNLELNRALTNGKFTSQLDSLHWQQADNIEFNLANLSIDSQMADLQDIPLGNVKLQLERLQLVESGKTVIELQEIQYHGQIDLDQALFNSTTELTFAQLRLADETLSDGKLKLVLSGVNPELLHSIKQTAAQLQQQMSNQQLNPIKLQLQLLGLYTELLRSEITVHLTEISVRVGNGKISGNGMLTLRQEPEAESTLFAPANVKANLHMEIDHSTFIAGYQLLNNLQPTDGQYQSQAVLAEQAEIIAAELVHKGILVHRDEDTYQIDFSWER